MKNKTIFTTFITGLSLLFGTHAIAQTFKAITAGPLTLNVYNAAESNFSVASVIVSGKTEAILVDAQFALPDAARVSAAIKASGKRLKAIYVSYGDPDYYFGLEIFKHDFPEVTVYATAPVVAHIKATAQQKLDFWGPQLGANGTKNIVLPQVFKGDTFELDGYQLKIIRVAGAPERAFVWIPAIKAVLGGINVTGTGVHLWTADDATKEKRSQWLKALEVIKALKPEIIIPAHFKPGTPFDMRALDYNREYLKTYQIELSKAKNSSALIRAMKKHYPDATAIDALELGAKVNKGEMKW